MDVSIEKMLNEAIENGDISGIQNIWLDLPFDVQMSSYKKFYDAIFSASSIKENYHDMVTNLKLMILNSYPDVMKEIFKTYTDYQIEDAIENGAERFSRLFDCTNFAFKELPGFFGSNEIIAGLFESMKAIKDKYPFENIPQEAVSRILAGFCDLPSSVVARHFEDICEIVFNLPGFNEYCDDFGPVMYAVGNRIGVVSTLLHIYEHSYAQMESPYPSFEDEDGNLKINLDDLHQVLNDFFISWNRFEKDSELRVALMKSFEDEIESGKIDVDNVNLYIRILYPNEDTRDVVINNIELLMSHTKNPLELTDDLTGLIDLPGAREGLNKNLDEILNEIIENDVDESTEFITKKALKEIIQYEGIEPADIKKINEGAFAYVYSFGNKVVKICTNGHREHVIPENSKRFIQPLIRFEVDSTDKYGDYAILGIEIQEKVDTESYVTEEELYEVYRDVREQGMVWTDVADRNVGRLLKPNRIFVDTIKTSHGEKHIFGPNLGFEKDREIEPLEAGEVVILDLDFIYPLSPDKNALEANLDCPINTKNLMKVFEQRYQEERCKKKMQNQDVSR